MSEKLAACDDCVWLKLKGYPALAPREKCKCVHGKRPQVFAYMYGIFIDDEWPFCGDINTDGHCPHFTPKEPVCLCENCTAFSKIDGCGYELTPEDGHCARFVRKVTDAG